jgi:MoaA/NifB/PqqE/SkfB family radical SAM enzyme
MSSILRILPTLPSYWTFRRFGWPRLLPFSLVISPSFRCNSRCRTCNVWRKPGSEMDLEEWARIFDRIGPGLLYLTVTGGEPFLRPDMAELVLAAYRACRPSLITIPTNGLLSRRIAEATDTICRDAPAATIGLNLSLDALGEEHDRIRMVPGNWSKALETWQALKELRLDHQNLLLSIHTVISRLNLPRIFEIYAGLQELAPDSYITEVAEERIELDTVGWDITPTAEEYAPIADFLARQALKGGRRGLARLTQAFRARYYWLASRILHECRQVIPCYAGWASAHIAPNGDVWSCCIRAQSVGNLRQHDYDLRSIWFGEEMDRLRQSIRAGECACPMANASYANMLLHPPTVLGVVASLLQ